MSVDLYYYPISFFSQKVRLALEEKKIPYRHVLINLVEGETITPWYMKSVNLLGQVPVIKHEEKFIADSNEIIKYLDRNFGGRTLYPDGDTEEGKQIADFMTRHAAQCRIPIITFGSACNPELCDGTKSIFMKKGIKEQMIRRDRERELRKLMEANPDLKQEYEKKIQPFQVFASQVTDKEYVRQNIEDCKKLFDFIEDTLRRNAEDGKADFFLYSNEFNMADITLTVTLERLRIVGLLNYIVLDGNHPYVAKYYERVLQRPTVQTAVVGGYDKWTLLRATIYFRLRDMRAPLFLAAAAGVTGYLAWQYCKKL